MSHSTPTSPAATLASDTLASDTLASATPAPTGESAAAPRPDLAPERAANLAENPYAGQGAVMLDVGGDIGAIVAYLPVELEGAEIEIVRADGAEVHLDHPHEHDQQHGHEHGHDHGHDHAAEHEPEHAHGHDHPHEHAAHHGHTHGHTPHVAVVGRPAGGEILYAAVFPGLESGVYRLNQAGESEIVEVTVEGGVIAEVTWPH